MHGGLIKRSLLLLFCFQQLYWVCMHAWMCALVLFAQQGCGSLLFITSVFTLRGFPPSKGWYIWLKYYREIITICVHCCQCWCQILAVFDEEKAAGNILLLFMSNAVNLLGYFKHSRCFNICCWVFGHDLTFYVQNILYCANKAAWCVWMWERERERESTCLCMHACMMCIH